MHDGTFADKSFAEELVYCKSRAFAQQTHVDLAQRLRGEGWIINGSYWKPDLRVWPDGWVEPLTLVGRRLLAI